MREIEQVIFNSRKGHRSGDEIAFQCPAHDDEHPSAYYNRVKEVWNCQACGARGGARDLAQRLGIELPAESSNDGTRPPDGSGANQTRAPFWIET